MVTSLVSLTTDTEPLPYTPCNAAWMFAAVLEGSSLTATLTVVSAVPTLALSTRVPPVAFRYRFCTSAVPGTPVASATPFVTSLTWTSASFTAAWRVRFEKSPGTSSFTTLVPAPRKLSSNGAVLVPLPVTTMVPAPVIASSAALMWAAVCVVLDATVIALVVLDTTPSSYLRVKLPASAPNGSTSNCTAAPLLPFVCTLGLSRSDDRLNNCA